MGYSGLIYAAIVAAWAAFLVPRWVRRNEDVERAREADTARRVRVLQRRTGPIHAPHGSPAAPEGEHIVLQGGTAGLTIGTATVPGHGARRESRRATSAMVVHEAGYSAAAGRRRRILLALLLLTLVVGLGAYAGRVPGWAPAVCVALTVLFLFLARRAAVAEAHRRRIASQRERRRRAIKQAAVEPEEAANEVDDDAPRRLVIPEADADVDDPDAWQPVPVPLPTYLTKPKAPRVARRIDLSLPGAWTSGSLDPASSIELPRADRAEDSSPASGGGQVDEQQEHEVEEAPEHRRAVGD